MCMDTSFDPLIHIDEDKGYHGCRASCLNVFSLNLIAIARLMCILW